MLDPWLLQWCFGSKGLRVKGVLFNSCLPHTCQICSEMFGAKRFAVLTSSTYSACFLNMSWRKRCLITRPSYHPTETMSHLDLRQVQAKWMLLYFVVIVQRLSAQEQPAAFISGFSPQLSLRRAGQSYGQTDQTKWKRCCNFVYQNATQ